MKKTLLALVATLTAACGDTPVSYSQPVGITLPALTSKGTISALSTDKAISTASANPYGAFVNGAKQRLGGRDPSHIAVTALVVSMTTTPAGLTFEQVFASGVGVSFLMSGSGISYPVGSVSSPTGLGTVGLQVGFDSAAMPPADYAALLQGQFNVVLIGLATTGSSGFNDTNPTDEKATIEATFGFIAYE